MKKKTIRKQKKFPSTAYVHKNWETIRTNHKNNLTKIVGINWHFIFRDYYRFTDLGIFRVKKFQIERKCNVSIEMDVF